MEFFTIAGLPTQQQRKFTRSVLHDGKRLARIATTSTLDLAERALLAAIQAGWNEVVILCEVIVIEDRKTPTFCGDGDSTNEKESCL